MALKPNFPFVPKPQLDFILHYLVLQKLTRQEPAVGKGYYRKANPYRVIQYYKSFQLISRLKGAALCDIKKQYIKKKRNPE